MSLEATIVELTLAINRLATSIQANTESGNRIVATLTNPEPNYAQPEQTQPVVDKDELLTQARESGEANTPTPTPAKRNRRTRAEIEAAKQTQPQAQPQAPAPDPTIATQQELPIEVEYPEEPDTRGTGPSLSDVREAAMKYRDKHGLEKARELLNLYKVTRIGELDFNQYSDFITDASK